MLLEQKILLLDSQIEDYKVRELYQKKRTETLFSNLSSNSNSDFEKQFEQELEKRINSSESKYENLKTE